MNVHVVLRSVTTAGGIVLGLYLFLVDYPFGTPLWQVFVYDRAGFIHEEFYVLAVVLSVLALDAWYEWQQTLRAALNSFLGFNGS